MTLKMHTFLKDPINIKYNLIIYKRTSKTIWCFRYKHQTSIWKHYIYVDLFDSRRINKYLNTARFMYIIHLYSLMALPFMREIKLVVNNI